MSAIWAWLIGPESDCLRMVSAGMVLVVWLSGGRLSAPAPHPPAGAPGAQRQRPNDMGRNGWEG